MWKIEVEEDKITLGTFYPVGWVLMFCAIWTALLFGLWKPIFEKGE
jgi:hypothetical protein